MTTLYQVAAANSGIVVGTGNKVEDFGVPTLFYTKYGGWWCRYFSDS